MENKKAQNPRNSYNRYIKVDLKVRNHFGCNDKAMLFSALAYWSGKKPEGFWKFKRPCKHRLYKKGDSWLEEIGVKHKAAFDRMFSEIVQVYKSKSEYLKVEDKFQGKMFVSYFERKTNLTHYVANWEAINKFQESLGLKKVSVPNKKQVHVSVTPSPAPVDNFSEAQKNLPLEASYNSEISKPPAIINNNIDIQTNTTLVATPPAQPVTTNEEEKLSLGYRGIGIWNSQMPTKVPLIESLALRLEGIIDDLFGGCEQTYKKFVEKVSSSAFLTGKAPNSKFKAFLFWAVKPEVIKTILSGGYGVKGIVSQISMMSEQGALETEIGKIQQDIDKVQTEINKEVAQLQNEHKKKIAQASKALSNPIRQAINAEVDKENPQGFPMEALRNLAVTLKTESYCRVQLGLCKEQDIIPPKELNDKLSELRDKKNANIKLLRIARDQNAKQEKDLLEKVSNATC